MRRGVAAGSTAELMGPYLETLPADDNLKEQLCARLSTMKRDVVGAPLWGSFKALLAGAKPPRALDFGRESRGGTVEGQEVPCRNSGGWERRVVVQENEPRRGQR